MSTSRKKDGIRCQESHPDENGPCDLLLMEERDGVVGIQDRNGHFASLTALNLVAMARGWVPNTEQDNKEKTVTTEVQKSHRYADQGQIDALMKIMGFYPIGDYLGMGTTREEQCRGGIVDNKVYLVERADKDMFHIRWISLPQNDECLRGELIQLTPTGLTELSWHDSNQDRQLYEHEAEELIEALKALPLPCRP